MLQIVLLVIETGFIVVLLGLLVEIVVETESYSEIRFYGILCTEVKVARNVCSNLLAVIELRNSCAVLFSGIVQTYLGVELVTC